MISTSISVPSYWLLFPLQGDTVRDRALDDMMNGVIEVKKDGILKMVGHNIAGCFVWNSKEGADIPSFGYIAKTTIVTIGQLFQ